jgi:hypothetical protein
VTSENCPGLVDQDGVGPNSADAFHEGSDLAYGQKIETVEKTVSCPFPA